MPRKFSRYIVFQGVSRSALVSGVSLLSRGFHFGKVLTPADGAIIAWLKPIVKQFNPDFLRL